MELTRAEEEVMQILWRLEQAYVKDILAQMPASRPAYNTVSTLVRILQDKKVVHHEVVGRSHRYYPLISREEYRKQKTRQLVKSYFGNSPRALLSFFVQEKELSSRDFDELLKQLKNRES